MRMFVNIFGRHVEVREVIGYYVENGQRYVEANVAGVHVIDIPVEDAEVRA